MKKIAMLILSAAVTVSAALAASYTNNTYKKLAKENTVKAQNALDAGEYVLAEEYAAKAQENAALSDSYIKMMISKDSASKNMTLAKNRLEYVKKIRGDVNFPIAYEAASGFYASAQKSFESEDFEAASVSSKKVIETLADVHEITPLPKYYIVRPWATDRDCFWNISGRPFVYNNPFLWENLYEANKSALPKPEDPNLILPGMKMEIPSLSGEYRDGVYTPGVKYEPFKPVK